MKKKRAPRRLLTSPRKTIVDGVAHRGRLEHKGTMSTIHWTGGPGNEYGKLCVAGGILLSTHVHDNGDGWTWGVWSAHPSASAIVSGVAVTREHAHRLTLAAVEKILLEALGGADPEKSAVQP